MDQPGAARTGGHVVLCGLNELGYRTLEELVRLGEDVVVIVPSPEEDLARGARHLGATLVPGNYRDQAVLRAAGVPVAGALVVTEDDDVGNLHAALAAQELNPALRVRLRMFNRELGRRVQELFPDCQVFDSAGLAVPAFVAAALLQDWQQRVEVDGRTLVVRQAAVTEPDVLLSLARVHPDGTADLFPDTDEQVLCLAEAPPTRRARRPERLAMEPPGRLAAAWTVVLGADVRLRVMAAIVLGLTVTGIAIFWWFSEQDLDLIDAIYFTVTIMTTTGFGDIHLRNAPPALQLYGVALMLSGTAALAILFALITDALISARLARVLGATIPPRPARPRGRVRAGQHRLPDGRAAPRPGRAGGRGRAAREQPATCRPCAAWASRCWWATSACPRRWRSCTSAGHARWWPPRPSPPPWPASTCWPRSRPGSRCWP